MAEPIILDTNVLKDIARGNKAAADALRRYVDAGRPVYISRAAYEELVTRAETPQLGGHYREILKDLHVKVAPSGTLTARGDFLADNIQHQPLPPARGRPQQPGQIREYDRKNDPTKPGDAFVAAQTKAIGGQLWTHDRDLAKRAEHLGVKLAPECRLPGTSGPEDPTRARQLLGLKPKPIGANGQVIPPAGGGTPGSYKATTGVADDHLPEPGGPSAKGQAKLNGLQMAFEGVNFVLNLVNDHIQKQKVDAALDGIRGAVAQARQANPALGVVLLFSYTQVEAPSASLIKPGAVFRSLTWGKGVTRDEAVRDALKSPTISQGVGPGSRAFSQEIWIPPLRPSTVTVARCPFPPVAVGRFFLGNGTTATFQLVSFDVFGGFDDVVEKRVDLPDGRNAEFAVLRAPAEVHWYNNNGRQTVRVPLKDQQTANGNTISAVDLDPYSPFHACAAMVFPIDDWAQAVFNTVGPTDGYRHLGTYVNFSMVRWVRASNIHLLRFL